MTKLSLASSRYSPIRCPGALAKVFSRHEMSAGIEPAAKVVKSRMWMPTSPSTPFEPCSVDSRHSQRGSVRQSPQAGWVSQLCR